MHTFFINTSGKELENYNIFFEVQHETRQLVSLECPMSKWQDKNVGYEACVNKMGEMIDSYKDITNSFNLILYVDLLPYKDYTSIPMDDQLKRCSCLEAMHAMLRHYIKDTIVKDLVDKGRTPNEVLIIFEENSSPQDHDEKTDEGKERTNCYIKQLLRWDNKDDIIKSVIESIPEEERNAKTFCDKLELKYQEESKELEPPVFDKILYTYPDYVKVLLDDSKKKQTKTIINNLCTNIAKGYADDDKVFTVIFETNRRVDVENKQANARRELRLCFYLYSCIDDESVKIDKSNQEDKRVKQFYDIEWKEVGRLMLEKRATYKQKRKKIKNLNETFSDLNLAPKLYKLDKKRFALDEFGKHANDESGAREMLLNKEFKKFDTNGDELDIQSLSSDNIDVERKATADEFIEKAEELRDHHLNFVYKLDNHLSNRLNNYAGRSRENNMAILSRRKVSLDDEDLDDECDYNYTLKNGGEKEKHETQQINVVEGISDRAYSTATLDYMEFCAARNVALTDIEDQCNWFKGRVEQIKESLKKIKYVAIGMFFAILILYIPFFLIQFESIFDNALTVSYAMASLAIPMVLLVAAYLLMWRLQTRKIYAAWVEFKQKSDEALENNKEAIDKYDQLLTTYIPALRYIYEYKLDVQFYADCCRLARAKVKHHLSKLEEMIPIIGNIVEDLEIEMNFDDDEEEIIGESGTDLEYQFSFCASKKNRKFYSIINNQFLEAVYKKKEAKTND